MNINEQLEARTELIEALLKVYKENLELIVELKEKTRQIGRVIDEHLERAKKNV